jgi:transposase
MGYHSEEFRKAAVQKLHSRGSRTIGEIARELGVSTYSLHHWDKRYATSLGMKDKSRRPQDWKAAEKFKAVMEFESLPPEKQGEFLRRKGLHSDHIAAWKADMEAGLESAGKSKSELRAERAEARRKIKDLERDLRRKDKALAETTALIVLKKKADLIWGKKDKDEDE